MENYEYYYLDGRERLWEEDILFFAERFLQGHPLLSKSNYFTMNWEEGIDKQHSYEYSNIHYDERLRMEFIEQINLLIPRISALDDFGVRYEASRAVALLKDGHSGVNMGVGDMIPLLFECIGKEANVQLCAVRVPPAYTHLLGSRLITINDIQIKEIVEAMATYLSQENEYHPIYQMTNLYDISHMQMVTQKPALQALGIVSKDSDHVEFTFETEDGIITEIMRFIPPSEYLNMELIEHDMVSNSSLRFRQDDNFWYTIVEDENNPYLYVRLRKMYTDIYDFNQFYTKVAAEIKNSEKTLRLIIDFRDNRGGELQIDTTTRFANSVNRLDVNGTYILINGGCFSAGVVTPFILAKTINGAKLVGSPTGQPANSFGPINEYLTPNYEMVFYISDCFYNFIPDEDDDAIYPDFTVYQTWEDYQSNIDTVLEYVLELE